MLNARFQQPEKARELTEAIEAVIDMKVSEGNRVYETLLYKDMEILRSELNAKLTGLDAKIDTKTADLKAELSKTIYVVGVVQFLGIVGSVPAIILFVMKH